MENMTKYTVRLSADSVEDALRGDIPGYGTWEIAPSAEGLSREDVDRAYMVAWGDPVEDGEGVLLRYEGLSWEYVNAAEDRDCITA